MFSLLNNEIHFPIGEFVKGDMHSHILPGIDDGAKDVETALKLISGLKALGYKKLTGTPHIMSDLYPNTPEIIQGAYNALRDGIAKEGIDISVSYAAEYLIDEQFPEKVEEGLLCIKDNIVLVETMFSALPPNIEEILFLMRSHNYQPILAHPERYHYLEDNLEQLDVFLKHGCKLQPNILSFTGYYGHKEKELAKKILDAGLIDYLGSDLHHRRHLGAIKHMRVSKKVARKLEKLNLQNWELLS